MNGFIGLRGIVFSTGLKEDCPGKNVAFWTGPKAVKSFIWDASPEMAMDLEEIILKFVLFVGPSAYSRFFRPFIYDGKVGSTLLKSRLFIKSEFYFLTNQYFKHVFRHKYIILKANK